MGKRDKKTAKGRLDKYYHLAKEQGYRARSAFKLIQLNKKYNFLERARCLIDLCAAPGGWLQVAQKYMPVSSLIVGVDLAAIKPIPNVITMQEDITTDKCRAQLRGHLKHWKADVVLHDGAPNVGTAWVQDAYSQSELVLMSLKLAVEFLNKGGTFVTKVFRSKDYNKLIWVFNQLFTKVEATKPPSSRNVSAEIFVVCKDFLAPKKIDPRFLDPKAVFSEIDLSQSSNKQIDIFHPEKKRRQRDGYDDGDYILFKSVPASEFIRSDDPISILSTVNKISFDGEDKEYLSMSCMDDEIKACCEDLKVLGKKDFRNLLRWRQAARKAVGLDEKKKVSKEEPEEKPEEEGEKSDEDAVYEELDSLAKSEEARLRRARRKANEKRQKQVLRMQLNMIAPTDIALDQASNGDGEVFSLKKIEKDGALSKLRKGDMSLTDSILDELEEDEDGDIHLDTGKKSRLSNTRKSQDPHEEEFEDDDDDEDNTDRLESQLDEMYEQYKERQAERDAKYRVKKMRNEEGEWTGIASDSEEEDDANEARKEDGDSTSESDSESEEENGKKRVRFADDSKGRKEKKGSLLRSLEQGDEDKPRKGELSKKAALWFDQPLFKSLEEDEEEEEEEEEEGAEEEDEVDMVELEDEENAKPEANGASTRKRKAEEEADEAVDGSDDEDSDDFEVVAAGESEDEDADMWEDDMQDGVKKSRDNNIGLITAEAMTLAQQLVNRQKSKSDLLDDGFNKRTFNDSHSLPEWFLDDEKKHNTPNLPVTKEAVQALRERLKAIDARPIKKIAEAKARKKAKAAQQLAKLQKKASAIAETSDMTEREKSQSIAKLMSKAVGKQRKPAQLVVARGGNRGIQGRPKGVKGRYKMVDPRMKKELRAVKRSESKSKGKGKRKKQKTG
ncbi:uncharacterized protein VTP21DRAFT_11163 [Calcarisporiella thermophila]|uniref:uncharacterized protein n=1 Tax=Calcarisporiella thermophila TaxID=911321 RepID=UPI0037431D8E